MQVADVVDRESLEAYLDSLDGDDREGTFKRVALYAACQILPLGIPYSRTRIEHRESLVLMAFGALLLADLACEGHSHLPDPLAAVASAASIRALDLGEPMLGDALHAASQGAYAGHEPFPEFDDAGLVAIDTLLKTSWDIGRIWQGLRAYLLDCQTLTKKVPEINLLDEPKEEWRIVRRGLSDEGFPHFRFWIQWFERLLAGRGTHSKLLAPIVEDIDGQEWQDDPVLMSAVFDGVLKVYLAEDAGGSLASATPVDFSFDSYLCVLRMVGITDTTKHLQDPKIVGAFLDDAQVQRELLEEFIDDMTTLQGGNYAGVLRKRAERLNKEFQRTDDLTHIRAEKVLSLAKSLEAASKDEKASADIGTMLSNDLGELLSGIKGLCRSYFGPAYLTLAPLAELNLDQIDQSEVIRLFEDAVQWLDQLNSDRLVPLDHEGVVVFQDMLDELRETLAFIDAASGDEFKQMLEGKFSATSGAFGLSFGRFFERSVEFGEVGDAAAKEVIKRHKQAKSLKDIIAVVVSILSTSGGGTP